MLEQYFAKSCHQAWLSCRTELQQPDLERDIRGKWPGDNSVVSKPFQCELIDDGNSALDTGIDALRFSKEDIRFWRGGDLAIVASEKWYANLVFELAEHL